MSYPAPEGRGVWRMSRVMPVFAPRSIAGLTDCNWRLAFAGSTNLGSRCRLADENAGAAPAPKNKLLLPEKCVVREFGARYFSVVVAAIMTLFTTVTAADAEIAPESLLTRR